MADSFQDKTENATPKQLSEARSKGNVPKSAEFNSIFILFTGLMTLYMLSGQFFLKITHGFRIFYQEIATFEMSRNGFHYYISLGADAVMGLIAPLVVIIALVGIGVNVAQTGFLFTTKPLVPDFKKLNPIAGFKKFVSLKSLVELLKSIFKVVIVAAIAYFTLKGEQERLLLLVYQDVSEILKFTGQVVFQIGIRTVSALLILAIFDLYYQRWQYKKDLKMTKQQVKDEQKQAEGDPLVKGHIRSLRLKRARERMMQSVAEADVVITNPTELAIALKYDIESTNAPVVLAKGARLLAAKIKKIAKENDIPIYENKPLAQSLFKICEIGKEIPFELFHAVAEVFAYVYQMKNKNGHQ